MMRRALATVLLGMIEACSRRDAPSTASGAPSPSVSASSSTSALLSGPSWSRDLLPYITKACAGAEGCHGDNPTDSVTFDLRAPTAYRELVSRPSEVRKGALLIVPGAPEKSFVVDKLTGKLSRKDGKAMPLDEATGAPKERTAEDNAFVEKILIPWIRAGADER